MHDENKSRLNLPRQFNIVSELLEKNVSDTPDNPAIHIVSPETLKVVRSITYSELWKRVNQVGNALLDSGVEIEQRVAIMLGDGYEFVSTFLGALKIGAVPILLSTYLSEEQLLFLLNDSRSKIVFIGIDYFEKLERIRPKLEHTNGFISDGRGSGIATGYDEFLGKASNKLEIANTSKDDVAFWFFTSGSTGMPKGVVHLHHDLYYAGLTYYDDVLHATKRDKFLSAAKLYFSAGLGFGLYGPLIMGASTVLFPGKSSAESMLKIIENAKPTAFLAVPTLYAQMAKTLSSSPSNLASVRIFATGGESLSPTVFEEWKSLTGVEITEAIGAAEITHHYISNILGKARPNTCGKLMDGYAAKIVDDEGNELGPNKMGRLLIKGESSFVYYWHLHEATKRTIIGEWIDNGDLFYKDDEDFFHFCGRVDFSFKIHGLWVTPIEIENAIMDSGLIRECCVVSIESEDGISAPVAYIVPKNQSFNEEEIVNALRNSLEAKLSKYKIPKKFLFLESLPKTSVGKLDRSAISMRAKKEKIDGA